MQSNTTVNISTGQFTYNTIRSDIISGELAPLQKLKLSDLSKLYNVSVNTLREVLMRLVADDLVVFEDQKGFSIIPATQEDLLELAELRTSLEILALKKSLKNPDINWKSKLVGAHYKLMCMEKAMLENQQENLLKWARADRHFHIVLVSNCGSRQLIRYHKIIIEKFMRYKIQELRNQPFRGEKAINEHQLILEHVLADDLDGTIELLTKHIGKCADVEF